MDKVFKVEITNGQPDGYLYATQLDLPARGFAYTQALRQARVTNFVRMEAEVLQVYQGPVTADMVAGAPLSDLKTSTPWRWSWPIWITCSWPGWRGCSRSTGSTTAAAPSPQRTSTA